MKKIYITPRIKVIIHNLDNVVMQRTSIKNGDEKSYNPEDVKSDVEVGAKSDSFNIWDDDEE